MSIHWPILRRCLLGPMHTAMVDDQRTWRRFELLLAALHAADRIEAVGRTRAVGVLLPTGGAFAAAALAGWILGKTVVPLNYLLKPEELQYVIDDCGTDTIVSAGPMLDFLGRRPRVDNIVRMDEIDFRQMPGPRWPGKDSSDADAGLTGIAVLLYTSGTSGRPKGVMLTHANLRSNIEQVIRYAGFTRRERFLGVLPQFHSFGLTVLTLLPLATGCEVIYTARFVPQRLIRLVREHRPTVFVGIPSMYNALLHTKEGGPADFAGVRYAICGGEPLPAAVSDAFFARFGIRLNEGYGLTETSPVTNVCLPGDYTPGSVGRTMPDLTLRIVDVESGRDVPVGTNGEIRFRGPNVMRGYYKLPAETKAAFDDRGFFKTGDIGRVDSVGRLAITGRLKEMLIVGGENVFPREIEEVLNRHPAIKDSGVVGLQDPVRGELPVAFVELKDDGNGNTVAFDLTSVLTHCRANLAGYKVPREIRVLDALPRNATGKVMRKELRKLVE